MIPTDDCDPRRSPEAQVLVTPEIVAAWSPVTSQEYFPLFSCVDYGLVHDMEELNHKKYQMVLKRCVFLLSILYHMSLAHEWN